MFYDVTGGRQRLLDLGKPIFVECINMPRVIAKDYNWSGTVYMIDYEKVFESYTHREVIQLLYQMSIIPNRLSLSRELQTFRREVLSTANLIQNSKIVERDYMCQFNVDFVNKQTCYLMQLKNEVEHYKLVKEIESI